MVLHALVGDGDIVLDCFVQRRLRGHTEKDVLDKLCVVHNAQLKKEVLDRCAQLATFGSSDCFPCSRILSFVALLTVSQEDRDTSAMNGANAPAVHLSTTVGSCPHTGNTREGVDRMDRICASACEHSESD